MPMSEEERRLLKELELGLIADDPHLAMELLSGYPARRFPAGLFSGVAVCLSALVLIMAGIGSQAPAAVVLGILLLGLGACLLLDRPLLDRMRRREQPTG
ncbi:VIT1/CCC1 family predicted Fe2+/Mn2+ transporter [Arthrobacter ulcerisalmonis]|nr:VIT1/CCC1 family predicted Fe2+/Mn2+ transporter [Arthrobacter ulcerisalmonis]